MTNEAASSIEELAEKDPKPKKDNAAKKTEDSAVRRLAKDSLIHKDKVKAAQKSLSRRRRRRARPPPQPLVVKL